MSDKPTIEAPALIGIGAQSIVDRSRSLGLTWALIPATVVDGTNANGVLLVLDGDSMPITAISMIGQLPPFARVFVQTVPPSGNYVVGFVNGGLNVASLTATKKVSDPRTSTTYIPDTELFVQVPYLGTWDVDCVLFYNGPSGGANGRLKVTFDFPAGALSMGHIGGINNSPSVTANIADVDFGAISNATASPTADFFMPTTGVANNLTVHFMGTLVNTASGLFAVNTAQIVASGTTTILLHSRLTLTMRN